MLTICLYLFVAGMAAPREGWQARDTSFHYEKQVFPLAIGGYGYRILRNNKTWIVQETIPGLPGRTAFRTRSDAGKVANLVLEKLRRGMMPPAVSRKELQQLGIHGITPAPSPPL